MSTVQEPVRVMIADELVEARVVDRSWRPDYEDPEEDVLVEVDGSEWWVAASAIQR